MTRDAEKRRASQQRYRERRKIQKYGPDAAGQDMRGRHGNHATGTSNARWNHSERRVTDQGYIAVRVPLDHPHAWGPKRLKNFRYAYEHHVVMMQLLGRPLRDDEGDDGDDKPAGSCEQEYEDVRINLFGRRSVKKQWRIVHTWTKWTSIDINIVGISKPHSVSGQTRHCLICGYQEMRRL